MHELDDNARRADRSANSATGRLTARKLAELAPSSENEIAWFRATVL
jgi:hypothetical protein